MFDGSDRVYCPTQCGSSGLLYLIDRPEVLLSTVKRAKEVCVSVFICVYECVCIYVCVSQRKEERKSV